MIPRFALNNKPPPPANNTNNKSQPRILRTKSSKVLLPESEAVDSQVSTSDLSTEQRIIIRPSDYLLHHTCCCPCPGHVTAAAVKRFSRLSLRVSIARVEHERPEMTVSMYRAHRKQPRNDVPSFAYARMKPWG